MKKNALTYQRISNEEQSNYSITGQPIFIGEFADRINVNIVESFVDDGYSAKDFNRPGWKALEIALEKNKNKIDFLIVLKYDRIIRDTLEGLIFIEKLEKKWGIRLLSVMENFNIDPHSPYFFKMRVDLLMAAEMERREGQRRTRFGIWSAQMQGRFINMAPFGYNNAHVMEGKRKVSFLTVNQDEAPVIKQVFDDYLAGMPWVVIIKKAREKGLKLTGNGTLPRIINNHTYAGLVKVGAFQNNESKIVNGTHPAIIDPEVFWRAYYKMQEETKPRVKIIDSNLPLRGMLQCGCCENPYTGSKSRGRSAFYHYYRCLNCRGENHSAVKVHSDIETILSGLSLSEQMITDLQTEIRCQEAEIRKEREHDLKRITREYEIARKKLDDLEEKFICNQIEETTYRKWHPAYLVEVDEKKQKVSVMSSGGDEKVSLFDTILPKLQDLPLLYNAFEIEGKQSFLKGIFVGGLYKEKNNYRTALLNELFIHNHLKINNMLIISKEKNRENMGQFSLVPGTRTKSNHLTGSNVEQFLRTVAKLVAVLLIVCGSARAQTTIEPCQFDTVAAIRKYLFDHRGEMPQNTTVQMGQIYREATKQTGIFLGGGIGIRNYVTHMDVKQNGKTVTVWKPAGEILMYYVSGQIVHGKNMFGMNLGNTTVSWSYTRHIN